MERAKGFRSLQLKLDVLNRFDRDKIDIQSATRLNYSTVRTIRVSAHAVRKSAQ